MSVNPRLPKEDQILAHLYSISEALHHISRDISHEIGPFKVGEIVGPEIIMDSPEVEQLKKQNKLLLITLLVSVSVTAIIGILDIVLRLLGK